MTFQLPYQSTVAHTWVIVRTQFDLKISLINYQRGKESRVSTHLMKIIWEIHQKIKTKNRCFQHTRTRVSNWLTNWLPVLLFLPDIHTGCSTIGEAEQVHVTRDSERYISVMSVTCGHVHKVQKARRNDEERRKNTHISYLQRIQHVSLNQM